MEMVHVLRFKELEIVPVWVIGYFEKLIDEPDELVIEIIRPFKRHRAGTGRDATQRRVAKSRSGEPGCCRTAGPVRLVELRTAGRDRSFNTFPPQVIYS